MSQDPEHIEPDSQLPPEPSDPPLREFSASPGPSGFPPPQMPYGAATGYGYPLPPPRYGYNVPPSEGPLPLGQALRQLPRQYFRVLTKPSENTFALEMGKASWDIVWAQLLINAVLLALISFIVIYLFLLLLASAFVQLINKSTSPASPSILLGFLPLSLGFFLGLIVLVPISFFIGEAIIYLLARAFGGTGTFLAQSYTSTLYTCPLTIINILLAWVPFINSFSGIGILVYTLILRIFAITAVHRLSSGKAAAVVLIPVGVGFVLSIVAVFVFFLLIIRSIPAQP